jgi:DNA adenine methylase
LHSRNLHDQAWIVYQAPEMFDSVKRAWAIWMLANSSYGNKLIGDYGYDKSTGGTTKKLANKRGSFTEACAVRLANAQIECCEALRIIRGRDTKESFFYCDPPYVGADQGHYDGYTQEDFDALLSTLEGISGKFLLSSYRNNALTEAIERNGWYTFKREMPCAMANRHGKPKKKLEVFTANYPIANTRKK